MIYQPPRRGVLTRAPAIGDAPFTHQTTRQNTQQHQECTVTTNAHPPTQRERTCTHPHKLAMTSAYLTGPFSHILLRARHHGDASRDSHRSATREHCQCAAGRCRGGHVWRGSPRPHAGSAPVARAASAMRVSRRPHAGSAPVVRASPAVRSRGAADHGHRLRASCQTVWTAAECVVTVRVISSLQVSVALILCG